jgi:hypothetical protein
MEQNGKQVLESRALNTLLNAPNILSRLFNTALLLSVITGVLYVWGTAYYFAFIKGLGLEPLSFAFDIPPNEILLGGANPLAQLLLGVALAYWSVVAVFIVAIILVVLIRLFVFPLLSLLLAPLAAKILHWAGVLFRKIAANPKFQKVATKLAPKMPDMKELERTVALIWSFAEIYILHALVWSLLVMLLLFWGVRKSDELGVKAAKNQLNNSPRVEITYGENEKIASTLCGRIGSDYIVRSVDKDGKEEEGKYVIIKETTIKKIIMMTKAAQAKAQEAVSK